ncbi:ubiquinone biosynthesis protein COQ9, mitochondrial [Onthophagus taurus]|uniref:ubiquinone biosynthesis protein COQ9, mitochondrial n=1 Tax=Onthophagus taurus TaxID=166361 RepID=UPI0039BDFACD
MSLVASFVSSVSTARFRLKHTCVVWLTSRNNSTNQQQSDTQNEKYEENIRNKILQASLKFVPSKGWSKDAIACGAEAVGYPGVTHGLFTKGGSDLVNYFQKVSNEELVQYMKNKSINPLKETSPAEFVEDAVKIRLEMIIPYLSKWPQAIAIMSLPPNVPTALASQLTMVDDICYYAGDRSVDFSWYARRVALAAIYKATELYLIQDKSQEHIETWKFLNNRLSEAIQIQNLLINSDGQTGRGSDTLMSAFVTARNILGMNNR